MKNHFLIALLFVISAMSCQMNNAKKEVQPVEEEIVTVVQIPDGAVTFTLNDDGMFVETTINGVPATVLLLARDNSFALDSAFVFSNQDSLKMSVVKKTKRVCRDGRCATRLINTVTPPTVLSFGNDEKTVKEEINIHNLMETPDGTKVAMEVPLFKILKDNILLIDVANNYIKTDITQDSLPHFVENFEDSIMFEFSNFNNYLSIMDSVSIYTPEETLHKTGVIYISLAFPCSIIFKENFINDVQKNKPITIYSSYFYYKEQAEKFHADSIIFSDLKTKIFDYELYAQKPEVISHFLGILGLDFFAHHCAVIDFNAKKLYLKAHER